MYKQIEKGTRIPLSELLNIISWMKHFVEKNWFMMHEQEFGVTFCHWAVISNSLSRLNCPHLLKVAFLKADQCPSLSAKE